MGRKKAKSDLGQFHKAAVESGITYAEAQIKETCRMIGQIRVPKGEDSDESPYKKVSTWNMLRNFGLLGAKRVVYLPHLTPNMKANIDEYMYREQISISQQYDSIKKSVREQQFKELGKLAEGN